MVMNLHDIIYRLPVGSKIKLKEDTDIYEIAGYEWYGNYGNIILSNGTKLNMSRLEQIELVCKDYI